ncbi:MAG: serine hydrolase [Longimicrobiales bacterium]
MIAIALSVPGRGSAQEAEFQAFDEYVSAAVRDWNVPGLAIAVVRNDSLVFASGYGVLDVGEPTPVDAHTRFAIGSTTKAMTTAALALLVDEGRLDWDDRVIDHLPEFQLHDPWVTRELTVRDLLTHRTGLPGTDLYWGVLDYDIAEMMRRLRYVEPVSSFRSHWEYQNVVYAIAGVIVERLSGMPWHEFVRTRLFMPLGMTETEPLDAGILREPNVAVPHDATNDSLHTVPKRSVDAVASVGSVWSSVTDMSKWLRFMLDSARVDTTRLITAETFSEIVTPVIHADMATYPALELSKPHGFSYALGWFIQDYAGDVVWMHTGSINGMSAIVGLLPDRRFGVVVLANRDHTELRHALMYRAFDLAADNPPRDWSAELREFFEREHRVATTPPADVTPPALPLDRYAGTYASPAYGAVRVTHAGEALQIAIGDGPARTLGHRDFEMFRTRDDASGNSFTVTFVPDGAGHIAAVRIFGATFERERERGR